MKKPCVILIGSASGIGKSTIASEVSRELRIKYLIETDFIREVIRGIIGEEYIPALHKSSFDAYTSLRSKKKFNSEEDMITEGFIEHASAVIPGVERVINRAIKDNDDIILEGVHLVPGLINLYQYKDKADVYFFILSASEDIHKQRFVKRATEIKRGGKHLEYFKENRAINNYLRDKALENDVIIINNESKESSLRTILNHINEVCTTVTLKHSVDDISIENEIVIKKYGARIENVSYILPGFKEPLKRRVNVYDYDESMKFTDNLEKNKKNKEDLEQLYKLSNNVHTHSICANDSKTLKSLLKELDEKGFLINDE